MSSESKEIRLKQKERFEGELEDRQAALTARGLDPKAIARDNAVRELRADVKKARKRLAAIDAQQELLKTLAERKAKKAAAPKKKKKKGEGKKKVEAAPKQGGGKKKKKK